MLAGDEISILSFSDGYTIKSLPCGQDHKQIYDGDNGPSKALFIFISILLLAKSSSHVKMLTRECARYWGYGLLRACTYCNPSAS